MVEVVTRREVEDAVEAAFAHPGFQRAKTDGLPLLLLDDDAGSVIWANEASFSGVEVASRDALRSALGSEVAFVLARARVPAGQAPRLARLRIGQAGRVPGIATVLYRKFVGPGGRAMTAVAILNDPSMKRRAGARSGEGRDWRATADPLLPGGLGGDGPLATPSGGGDGERPGNRADDVPIRFVWRTDASDAVEAFDVAAFTALGAAVTLQASVSLPRAVAAFDTEGAGRLARALATRRTWGGIELSWPLDEGRATVPVQLSAVPAFDGARRFTGFRGFGSIEVHRATPVPLAPRPPALPDAGVAADARLGAPSYAGLRAEPEKEQDAGYERAAPPATNVFVLRPSLPSASGKAATRGDAKPANGAFAEAAEVGELSSSEHLAFEEIGRRLSELGVGAVDLDGTIPPAREGEPARLAAPADPIPHHRSAEPSPASAGEGSGDAWHAAPTKTALTAFLDATGSALLLLDEDGGRHLGHQGTRRRPVDSDGPGATPARDGARAPSVASARPASGERSAPPARIETGEASGEAWRVPPAVDVLATFLDAAGDALMLLDAQGIIRRLNRHGRQWFGADAADLVGRTCGSVLTPESEGVATKLLDRMREGPAEAFLSADVTARTVDGVPTPMRLTLWRSGPDHLHAAWRKLDPPAAKTDETAPGRPGWLQPGLLAKVSQEIRAPLNAILGFAELMLDERFGALGSPRYKDYLNDIHASVTRVLSLVGDVLDLSRVEAARPDLDFSPLDVNKVIAECVTATQAQAHRGRVIMRTALGPRLRPVLADERSVRQIIHNLLANAVAYNEPGGQVIVSTAPLENGGVAVRVRDTGVGMSDEEIEAALGSMQPPPSSLPGGGAGLGLPLTRALVGANGATMSIQSRPKGGTLVEVVFAPAPEAAARVPA